MANLPPEAIVNHNECTKVHCREKDLVAVKLLKDNLPRDTVSPFCPSQVCFPAERGRRDFLVFDRSQLEDELRLVRAWGNGKYLKF
eukprot:1157667-Pelagomonas_calceolata.AAC.3